MTWVASLRRKLSPAKFSSSFLPPGALLSAVTQLHGVLIDVIGDCLAFGIANRDRAWVVHASPDPRGVPIRSRLRNAVVCATRLSVVVSMNVCSSSKWFRRTVAAAPLRLGCPAGYSGCDGVFMSCPAEIRDGVRIAIVVRQWDRGHRPPGYYIRITAVGLFAAPSGERGIGHRDVQDREQPIGVGNG